MSDYADIADLSWDNIQEPKTLPVGSYLLRASNASFQPAKDADKSPVVMFVYRVKEPMDDVKTEELEELGAEYDITENKVFHRIYIEDGSSWDQVRKHLEKHRVEMVSGEGGVLKTLKKFKGTEVIAYLEQRSFTRASGEVGIANNATTFAAVDAD